MLFKKKHVKMILRREKTQTRRRIGTYSYKVGKIYGIRSEWFQKSVAYILITRKRIETLGDISSEDAEKEGYASVEAFQAAWININGTWDPELQVYVYDFRLVENAYGKLVNSYEVRQYEPS